MYSILRNNFRNMFFLLKSSFGLVAMYLSIDEEVPDSIPSFPLEVLFSGGLL